MGVVKLLARPAAGVKWLVTTPDGRFGRDLTLRRRERRRLRDDVPFPPASAHHRAIVRCRERVAAGSKLVGDRAEHGTKARSVPQALEPLQTSLTLADRSVRVLDAVVLAPAAEMGDGRHHDRFRRRVARQPIGHDGARHHP